MPKYKMDEGKVYPETVQDRTIVSDVLTHLSSVIYRCELKEITRRRGISKATHGVAKMFGHRNAHADLFLAASFAVKESNRKRESGEEDHYYFWIPFTVKNGTVSIYYRIMLLGTETTRAKDKLAGHSATPNQIETNARSNFTEFWVDIELTGAAMAQLCSDTKNKPLWQNYLKLWLQRKWGSMGTTADGAKATEGEKYRYVRMVDGIPRVYCAGGGAFHSEWFAPGAWASMGPPG